MNYFPAFLNLTARECLVCGGGVVALRKVRLLLESGARVIIAAPQIHVELQELVNSFKIRWQTKNMDELNFGAYWLIIAATDNAEFNKRIATHAERAKTWCNLVDNAENSNFIVPAIVDRGPLTVAISSAGLSPVLARIVKAKIEKLLPPNFGELAAFAGRWRQKVAQILTDQKSRRRFWEETLTGTIADLVLNHKVPSANQKLQDQLEISKSAGYLKQSGIGYLVGAGPGDVNLITVRGRNVLERADVVLYDRLVSEDLLKVARRDAELIFVGKQCGQPGINQAEINKLFVNKVQSGNRVCRLKGGDPFLFGRGGEEVAALQQNGLEYEIIPGVTAAIGCAAYAGIPLTHRGLASKVTFITAQGHAGVPEMDWRALAVSKQTLVFYMGVRRYRWIAENLMAAGAARNLSCAIVSRGTLPQQSVTLTSLSQLSQSSRNESFTPAVLIVGEVTRFASANNWYGLDLVEPRLPLPAIGAI